MEKKKTWLNKISEMPISFQYNSPTSEFIAALHLDCQPCVIQKTKNIFPANWYYQQGLPGTKEKIYSRKAVVNRLLKIADLLAPEYGLYIFDAFRSLETQAFLFKDFFQQIKSKHPNLTEEQLQVETRKYVSHPHEPSRFAVAPHHSGGAIDLAIYNIKTGELWEFGSEFDQTDSISSTDFFEKNYDSQYGFSEDQWLLIKKNRRILFHLMVDQGFTNYETEWWHYDLGDCLWAHYLKTEWVFPALQ